MSAEPVHRAGFDAEFVRRALEQADPNVLRMALYQLTGDADLAAMEVDHVPARGGVLVADVLADKHHETVRQKAFAYLSWVDLEAPPPPPPSDAEAFELMDLFAGRKHSPNEHRFGLEELAFTDFPRDVTWSRDVPRDVIDRHHVLVVGCGISGVTMGVMMNRLGLNYTIIERREGLGGTWWINQYPDCRVDVTSFLYQFKFVKKYPWSEYYASREETLKYLQHVADEYDVTPKVRFNTELVSAIWNAETSQWTARVKGPDGAEYDIIADFIVSAAGLFATPKMPDIAGIEDYQGKLVHTTQWDNDYDYAGKRVAVIGTGSTGCQTMPRIAKTAAQVSVFQRTPQWVMPAENYRGSITPEMQWLFDNVPYYWNWYVFSAFSTTTKLQDLQRYDRAWQAKGGLINERNDTLRRNLEAYIKEQIGDRPELYARLQPNFAPLGRRSVIDNGFYAALKQDHVELVSEGIDHFTPTGIATSDGQVREFDLVVMAAGFHTSKFLWPVHYAGRDGATLEDLWSKDGARSFMGTTLPKFPNFFICYGPNGQPRSGGFYSWAEVWARYILQGIVHVIEHDDVRSIEIRQDVFEKWNDDLDEEMKNLIWNTEAKGAYYLNEFGRMGLNVPYDVQDFHEMMSRLDIDQFDIR